MTRRPGRSPRLATRVSALLLLSLIASFALTATADPCGAGDDCDARPCHILCVDGCTTTPVPPIEVDGAPVLQAHAPVSLLRPLVPPVPSLDAVYRPPRAIA